MSTDPHARLAEFLAVGDNKQNLPGVVIRDAATMMVIDRSGPAPKVLLGRRHQGHKFMPGKYVFPGGRVERADRRVAAATALDSRVEARLMQGVRRPSPAKARSFALAAIREVFEETGLVLGAKADTALSAMRAGMPQVPGTPDPHLPKPSTLKPSTLKPGTLKPGDPTDAAGSEWGKFATTGVQPDLSGVHFIARAITPPGRPRRFDTRFFAVDAEAIAARIDGVVGPDTELVELVWLPIDATLKLDMAGITLAVMEELKIRTAGGFGHDLAVPFYRVHRGTRLRTLLT
jgi:8-oxo-dGTP pyrophosphatase MutT (NUDIX family)